MTRPDWAAIESRPATREWMHEEPHFDWTVLRDGVAILLFIGAVLAACITGFAA